MTIELTIPTVTCGGCVRAVTAAVREVAPTARVSAEVATRRVSVADAPDEALVRAALQKAGFPPIE